MSNISVSVKKKKKNSHPPSLWKDKSHHLWEAYAQVCHVWGSVKSEMVAAAGDMRYLLKLHRESEFEARENTAGSGTR